MKTQRSVTFAFILSMITAVVLLSPGKQTAVEASDQEEPPVLPDPYLVKNINPATLPSDPRCHKIDDQRALCLANDFEHDFEPWLTDGTEEGTFLLKEIMPGSREEYEILEVVPTGIGSFYFTSYDYYHSTLWLSDGTTPGTVKVVDFCSHAGYGQGREMRSLVMLGDTLYFAGYCIDDLALWKSNGTPATTEHVVGFQGFNLEFFKMVPFKNRLYYVDGEGFLYGEYRLWQSDGTAANTVKYSDRSVNWRSDLVVFKDRLYLSALFGEGSYFGDDRWQLASTDGTGEIEMLKDLDIQYPHDQPDQLTSAGNLLFFYVDDSDGQNRLWRTDGTSAGTTGIKDFADYEYVTLLGANGSTLYFVVNNEDLWTSDGSSGGTRLLKEFEPWEYVGYDDRGKCTLTHVSGQNGFYVQAKTTATGCELWRSKNPTEIEIVRDIVPGGEGSFAAPQAALGSRILFAASGWPAGREPWVTEGTENSTVLLRDISELEDAYSAPHGLTNHQEILYFAADDGLHGKELWRSDGVTENTVMVKDIAPGKADSGPSMLTSLPQDLVFQTYIVNGGTAGVWSSAGTAASTRTLTKGLSAGDIMGETFNGYAFFSVFDLAHDTHAFYRTDGTKPGTIKLADLQHAHRSAAGNSAFYFSYFTDYENRKYGLAYTDGTAAGTKVVNGLPPCSFSINDMATIGDLLLFTWCDEHGRPAIWRLEDPGAAPELIFNGTNVDSGSMTASEDLIFFVGREPEAGFALWRSDGTATGTKFIKPLPKFIFHFYPFGDQLFFAMEDEGTGEELWVSDGTSEGTGMVKDIYPGGHSSQPFIRTDNGRYIFFRARDSQGERIWASDGTEGGTFAITGTQLENKEYEPGEMMVAGDLLFIAPQILAMEHSWYGSVYERELWAIDISLLRGSLTADFSASPISGAVPLHVKFKNESSGYYNSCQWNFGDGRTADGCADQTHAYTRTGSFSVTLTVSGSSGEDTKTRHSYITVAEQSCYLPVTFKN